MQIATAEHRQAHIRMISDTILLGRLDEEKAKDLEYSRAQETQAELRLWMNFETGNLTKCRNAPNRPYLKELIWDGAHLMHEEGAQTLVDVSDGTPRWRQEYEIYLEKAKAKKAQRVATKMESIKAKQKAKNKARKARKRVAGTSALGASTPKTTHEASRSCVQATNDENMEVGGGYEEENNDDGGSSGDDGPEPVEGNF